MSIRLPILWPLLVAVSWLAPPDDFTRAMAGEPSSSDDELLGGLMADPLDPEVERELFGSDDPAADDPAAQPQGPSETEADELNDQLLRELGAAAVRGDENPLLEISRQMRRVEGRIARSDSGSKTQDLQGEVVASLDELIEQARQRCRQCQASASQSQAVAARKPIKQPGKKPSEGGQKPGTKPARDSTAKPGTAEAHRPDGEERESLVRGMAIWGELPEAQREQMINAWIEEFLPKYELLIEDYFRRLADEQGL